MTIHNASSWRITENYERGEWRKDERMPQRLSGHIMARGDVLECGDSLCSHSTGRTQDKDPI